MEVHGAKEVRGRCGNWLVTRYIAGGGFGNVYEVEHVGTGRRAALKLLRSELCADRDAVARFEREASLVSQLTLPGLAEIYEVGELASGEPFIVMELLQGEDLRARIRRQGRLAASEALAILSSLAEVLDQAHARGVIHRDVKASNVFLTPPSSAAPPREERVTLLDFGHGKLLHGTEAELTASRQLIGTPSSMAPEQVTGGPVTAATDVYALGALAFTMLAGKAPFSHESPVVLCQMHLHARIPNISALSPLPPALDSVLGRAMSKGPENRYQTCTAFIVALREALSCAAEAREVPIAIIRVSVAAPPSALCGTDLALIEDFEAVPMLASRELERAGLCVALRTGNVVAYYRELPPSFELALSAARGLRKLTREVQAALAHRSHPHPSVRWDVRRLTGRAVLRGVTLVSSAILEGALEPGPE